MTLAPGTRLGPYEVVAPLGAGGMGEVYRARDTRLGRDVAIKVLPSHLSANAEVRARFEREAKTVSGLNHPNVCTLFDVGREGETDYLVMELVEGETLAERLRKGALPMPDVLRIGTQVADALDRAHRAGVVHRDLKPGNIMLARSGAKLMDFGLARATATAGPVSGSGATMAALTQHPTVVSPLTAEGAIVGTFQYMAPEQLEGREADTRSDLWALGCVLYEMATGRRAFEGRSQASLITAIMGSQPAPLVTLAPMSPPALERLVNALLAKDADDRIQTAHDVKLQLGWMSEPGSVSGTSEVSGAKASMPGARRRGAPAWLAVLLGVAGVFVGVLAGALLLRRPEPPVVAQVPRPDWLDIPSAWVSVAIAPDGRSVVAVGADARGSEPGGLWLWRLDNAAPTALTGTQSGFLPCWSPDSRSIAYFDFAKMALCTVPAAGGTPTRLCEFSDGRGVSWGSKGMLVFAPAPSGPLYKIKASGGTPEQATELDAGAGESSHRCPVMLPDGEHFLFTALPGGAEGYSIRVGSLSSRASHEVLKAQSGASYTRGGWLVFVRDGRLLAQRFDARKLRVNGEPITFGEAPPYSDFDGEPPVSESVDGSLLLSRSPSPQCRLEWFDRSGVSRGVVPVEESDWLVHAISPDHKYALAVSQRSLWQVDLERGVPTQLLPSVDPEEMVAWSPDGRRIAATSRMAGREVVRLIPAGGSGPRDSVGVPGATFQAVHGWSSGGDLLVAALGRITEHEVGASSSWDLWRVPLSGPAVPYEASPVFERYSALSPDGAWAAWFATVSGKLDLLVDSWPEPGRRLQVVAGMAQHPTTVWWGRGGQELLYVDPDRRLVAVPIRFTGGVPQAGAATPLFRLPAGATRLATRDGERFLVSLDDHPATGVDLILIQHWEGLLRK